MHVYPKIALVTLVILVAAACGSSGTSGSECSGNSDCPSQCCVVGACTVSAAIGPEGGQLSTKLVALTIPAGALTATTTVTITPSPAESGGKSLVFTVDLGGQILNSDATLTITFGSDTSDYVIVKRAAGPIFEKCDGSTSSSDGTISCPISKGGAFMVAPAPPQ